MTNHRFAKLLYFTIPIYLLVGLARGESPGSPSTAAPTPTRHYQVDTRILDIHERRVDELRRSRDQLAEKLQDSDNAIQSLDGLLVKMDQERDVLLRLHELLHAWKDATFILATERTAVGVRAEGTEAMSLHARTSVGEREFVSRIANRYSIPFVSENDPRFENLGMNLRVGDRFDESSLALLRDFWKVRKYVPFGPHDEAPMVAFKDQETNRFRVGYLVSMEAYSLNFHPIGSRTETVHRQQIESGTARRGSSSQLLIEPEVDYLDVASLEIARHLASKANAPSFHAVALDVDVDELEEAITLSKQLDVTDNDRLLDLLSRLSGEAYVPDQRKEGVRILRRYGEVLHDELSTRMVSLAIPMAAREELRSIIQERELSEGKHFDRKRHSPLTSSSHLVTARVGKPQSGGTFRISIRLVDNQSGKILYESTSDIGRPSNRCPTNYYIHGGEPGLLVERSATTSRDAINRPQPLQLTSVSSAPIASRVGLFADHSADRFAYQDLFATRSVLLSSARFEKRPIVDPKTLPTSERLRWLTWELMKAALPTAGKVVRLDAERIELNIGSNHGIRPGTVFRVLRPKDDSRNQTQMVLPTELRADTVTTQTTMAFLQQDGLELLWEGSTLEPGDIVLPRGATDSRIRIASLQFDPGLMEKEDRDKNRAMRFNLLQQKRLIGSMESMSEKLIHKIVQGLQRQGITAVGSKQTNPTHEIVGAIAPIGSGPDATRFRIAFSIKSLTDERIAGLPASIPVSHKEIDEWQP